MPLFRRALFFSKNFYNSFSFLLDFSIVSSFYIYRIDTISYFLRFVKPLPPIFLKRRVSRFSFCGKQNPSKVGIIPLSLTCFLFWAKSYHLPVPFCLPFLTIFLFVPFYKTVNIALSLQIRVCLQLCSNVCPIQCRFIPLCISKQVSL